MTTIAADHRVGVMVSDSKCTIETIWIPSVKIFRHRDELIGMAGDVSDGARWFDWYTSGKKGAGPKLALVEALVLRARGLFFVLQDNSELRMERGFHSIGSGGPAATAVMLAGHTAEEAVGIACLVDAQSGGDIQVLTLKDTT